MPSPLPAGKPGSRVEPIGFGIICALALCLNVRAAENLDLAHATIVSASDLTRVERSAVRMLAGEVARRSQVRWSNKNEFPASGPCIVVGTLDEVKRLTGLKKPRLPAAVGLSRAEGYSIWAEASGNSLRVFVVGHDRRGVLFGVGRLLRELRIERQKISLAEDFKINSAPQMPLRGHQLSF